MQTWCASGCRSQYRHAVTARDLQLDLLDRCDLGVKIAALAALGEMAALRDEGVREPFVLGWRGVNDGESTLNLFLTFSF
jgi:hypothetical protein